MSNFFAPQLPFPPPDDDGSAPAVGSDRDEALRVPAEEFEVKPHDSLFKSSFSSKVNATGLLALTLGDSLPLNYATLRRCDPTTTKSDLTQQHNDLAFHASTDSYYSLLVQFRQLVTVINEITADLQRLSDDDLDMVLGYIGRVTPDHTFDEIRPTIQGYNALPSSGGGGQRALRAAARATISPNSS